MGLFDFLKTGSAPERFADRVMTRLAEMGWPHPMTYEPETFAINLGGSAGSLALGNIFADWRAHPRGRQAEALDQAIAFVFESGPESFEDAKPYLVPILRARVQVQALTGEAPEVAKSWRPFSEHLAAQIAVDRPHSLMILGGSTLAEWGLGFGEAMAAAVANLAEAEGLVFARQEGGFYVSEGEDYNDIGRLLLPDAVVGAPIKGMPVLLPLARDFLLLAGSEEPAALEAMAREAALQLVHISRPISCAPLVFEEGRWRPYEPPFELSAVRELAVHQQALGFNQHAGPLLEKLRTAGRLEGVAPVIVMSTEDGPRTVAHWYVEACLLPKVDYVVGRTREGHQMLLGLDAVAEVFGFASELDTPLPYYVATTWPQRDAVAVAEPAWVKGKGVSLVDGRLSFFG